jgi:hypothetical protein
MVLDGEAEIGATLELGSGNDNSRTGNRVMDVSLVHTSRSLPTRGTQRTI